MTAIMRRVEITIEKRTSLIVRRRASIFCERCGRATTALTIGEVAALFLTSVGAIQSLADADEIHFVETSESEFPFVCAASLKIEKTNLENSR